MFFCFFLECALIYNKAEGYQLGEKLGNVTQSKIRRNISALYQI